MCHCFCLFCRSGGDGRHARRHLRQGEGGDRRRERAQHLGAAEGAPVTLPPVDLPTSTRPPPAPPSPPATPTTPPTPESHTHLITLNYFLL